MKIHLIFFGIKDYGNCFIRPIQLAIRCLSPSILKSATSIDNPLSIERSSPHNPSLNTVIHSERDYPHGQFSVSSILH